MRNETGLLPAFRVYRLPPKDNHRQSWSGSQNVEPLPHTQLLSSPHGQGEAVLLSRLYISHDILLSFNRRYFKMSAGKGRKEVQPLA